jgi:predicted RNA-binding Zn-ribbon protein involved in translation (DUF1610 family)
MTVPILSAHQDWYCPNCGLRDQTRETRPHSRFHTCPKLGFLSAPMLPATVKAKVEVHEREDYVGKEIVTRDSANRPVMSIITTRDNGTDALVFAPLATARGDA